MKVNLYLLPLALSALACGTVTPVTPTSESTRIHDAQISAPVQTAAPVLVEATPYAVMITADVLYIRSCASTNCAVIGALGRDALVTPLDRVHNDTDARCTEWYKIEGGYICEFFTVKP